MTKYRGRPKVLGAVRPLPVYLEPEDFGVLDQLSLKYGGISKSGVIRKLIRPPQGQADTDSSAELSRTKLELSLANDRIKELEEEKRKAQEMQNKKSEVEIRTDGRGHLIKIGEKDKWWTL